MIIIFWNNKTDSQQLKKHALKITRNLLRPTKPNCATDINCTYNYNASDDVTLWHNRLYIFDKTDNKDTAALVKVSM